MKEFLKKIEIKEFLKKIDWKKEILEWGKAIAVVLFVYFFIVAFCTVEGSSMEPNFTSGERVVLNKLLYRFRDPVAGEVIVFHVPEEGYDLIKRVIAVAGDKVKVDGDDVYVNGKKIEEKYLEEIIAERHAQKELYNNRNFEEDTVPEGHVFVMGDNRSNSKDSRSLGFIDLKRVSGRTDVVFWPLTKIRLTK